MDSCVHFILKLDLRWMYTLNVYGNNLKYWDILKYEMSIGLLIKITKLINLSI